MRSAVIRGLLIIMAVPFFFPHIIDFLNFLADFNIEAHKRCLSNHVSDKDYKAHIQCMEKEKNRRKATKYTGMYSQMIDSLFCTKGFSYFKWSGVSSDIYCRCSDDFLFNVRTVEIACRRA